VIGARTGTCTIHHLNGFRSGGSSCEMVCSSARTRHAKKVQQATSLLKGPTTLWSLRSSHHQQAGRLLYKRLDHFLIAAAAARSAVALTAGIRELLIARIPFFDNIQPRGRTCIPASITKGHNNSEVGKDSTACYRPESHPQTTQS
jgi:hypothetical protein